MANIGNTIALIQALAPKPDPSVIEQSVSDWLEDHPEATTTVQDGSITKAKLDNNLQQAVDKVDDIVAIQTTQPTSPDNKIWIDTTNSGTGIQVPTYEELTDLKNELLQDYANTISVEQGYWATSTGLPTDSATWCRTNKFINKYSIIKTTTLNMWLLAFNKNTGEYVGGWNGSVFSTTHNSSLAIKEYNIAEFVKNYPNYMFAISFSKNANITPSDVYAEMIIKNAIIEDDIGNLNDSLTALSMAFCDLNNYEEAVYTQEKIYATNTDPIVLTPVNTSGFSCALVPCEEGDTFVITGRGATAAHYFVFVKSDGTKIYDGGVQSNWAENNLVIAPKDSAYLVLNNYNSYGTPKCIKNKAYYLEEDFNVNDFENGSLSSLDGTEGTASRFRSVDYLDLSDIIKITASSSNRVALFCYTSASADSFIGIFKGDSIGTSGNVLFYENINLANIRWSPSYRNLKYRIEFETTSISGGKKYSFKKSPQVVMNILNENIEGIKKDVEETQEEIHDLGYGLFTSDNYFISNDIVELASSSSALFSLYDALVTNYPNIVTKNTLTSGNLTNYEYVFSTGNYNSAGQRSRDSAIVKPTIMMTVGVHGDEKSAVMSTYALFKAMCEGAFPVASIIEKCTIRLIPCVCQWGFDHDKRYNENGVNINRNFDANWVAQGEPYDSGYSGPSAASEDETKIVQAWVDSNIANSVMFLDFHNSGYTNEVSWLSFLNTLSDSSKMKNEYRYRIDNIIGYWKAKRGMTSSSLIYGYTGASNITGGCDMYGVKKGGFAGAFETTWNENNFGLHSKKTIGVGCEALSCVLLGAIECLVEVD